MTYTQLYTVISECELELPTSVHIPHYSQDYYFESCRNGYHIDDLEIQSGFGDFIGSYIGEIASALARFLNDDSAKKQVLNIFYTFCWVMGRLARVIDFHDIIAIGDYITRVHYDIPIGKFMVLWLMEQELDAQSMDWSVLKNLVSSYETLKTHPAVIKFIKVVSLAFSGGILSSLGIETKTAELWTMITECVSKILGHGDFISAMLDLFHFIGERIAAFCVSGSWSSLLHTPSGYAEWVDEAHLIMEQSVALCNLDAIGTDYHQFVSSLCKCITKGEEIKKYLKAADARDCISQVLSRLRMLHTNILVDEAAGKMRMAPFSLLISAGSSVGKSSFMDTVKTHFAKVYKKPIGAEYVYCRTPQEKHWNNFKTPMWCVIIDDIASINPNIASEDPSLSDVLLSVGNTNFSPPQAALEDKGKTPFMAELIMATTNTEDLKAHCWFNNPQAIRRRFPYIVNLKPKEAYRIKGTNMLDSSRVPPTLPGYYPDLWEITVKEVRVEPNETIKTEVILTTDSIYLFMAEFNEWTSDHRAGQAAFMISKKNTENAELCQIHLLPKVICDCQNIDMCDLLEAQSGDDDSLETQAYILPEVTPELIAKICIGGAVTYGTAKTVSFFTRRISECINRDPNLINSPVQLVAHAAHRALRLGRAYAKRKYNHLKSLTKDKIKEILRDALYEKYAEYKPLLKKLLMGVSFIAALGITWSILKKEVPELANLDTQVDIDNVGVNPKPAKEMENVWRKDDYQPSDFLGRLSLSWANLSLSKAAAIVARNTVWCKTTHGNDKHSNFRALCLSGHLYVVPNHVLPCDDYFHIQVIHENNSEGCNGNVYFKMSQQNIFRCREKELAFFEINHMPGRRNITGILPKKGCTFDAPGRMIIRQPNATVEYIDTKRTNFVPDQFMDQFNMVLDACSSHVPHDTSKGDCGAPTLVQQPNAIILGGIHVLGGHRHLAVSVLVYQDDYESALSHFDTPTVENDIPFLEGQNFTTNISAKCTARYLQEGTVQVFGSFGGFKRQPKSTACSTLFTNTLVNDGHVIKHGPAPMKGYMPLHHGIKDMVQKQMEFKCDVVRLCSSSFAKSVIDNLPQNFKEEMISPLTLKAALNGYPGTRFIDSMNFGTSAGYPHNHSKRDFIIRVPQDSVWQHPVILTDDIKNEVHDIWNKMVNGVSSAPVFMQHIKDEALPLRKIKEQKARLFMGGPFAWSICVRMALLPFIRVMQINKYLFECAPGTNATSIEWSRIYTYITRFGVNRLIAGDFKSFDKNMGSLVIMEAFRFIRIIMKDAGAEESHLRAIQVIAEDTSFAFVNFNGDLMRFFGSNPSGHPLTVIINCIVNSIYMRYCYYELNPDHEVYTFKDNVRLLTYGDDNMANSRVDWFNHTAIASILASVGITYTMADKLATSVPFIHITETSFLKRTFRFDKELNSHMAVLEEDSIWKSMLIWLPSKEVSPQKQAIDIITTNIGEWFFYGRERFEKERSYLLELVKRVDLEYYTDKNTFPTWDELCERYYSASTNYLEQEPLTSIDILGKCRWEPPILLD